MTDKKIIFKTGEITYDKEWYEKSGLEVKPVVYTDGFLKDIASNTMGSSLELTHGNNKLDVIGHINDYDFIDNDLVANITTNEELSGKGFSPEFSANFRDLGDKYEAIDGKLIKVILTDTPRSHILCNSVEGGSNMSEETVKILNNQIKELNKELAKKDAIINANKEKIKEYDELTSKIETLEEENNTYKTQIDGLKPKAEAYSKIEDQRRAELLNTAFGDNDEAKKGWENATMEQLESLAKYREISKPAKGIGAGAAEGLDEGDGQENESDDPTPQDALNYYEKTFGEKPSFLE